MGVGWGWGQAAYVKLFSQLPAPNKVFVAHRVGRMRCDGDAHEGVVAVLLNHFAHVGEVAVKVGRVRGRKVCAGHATGRARGVTADGLDRPSGRVGKGACADAPKSGTPMVARMPVFWRTAAVASQKKYMSAKHVVPLLIISAMASSVPSYTKS